MLGASGSSGGKAGRGHAGGRTTARLGRPSARSRLRPNGPTSTPPSTKPVICGSRAICASPRLRSIVWYPPPVCICTGTLAATLRSRAVKASAGAGHCCGTCILFGWHAVVYVQVGETSLAPAQCAPPRKVQARASPGHTGADRQRTWRATAHCAAAAVPGFLAHGGHANSGMTRSGQLGCLSLRAIWPCRQYVEPSWACAVQVQLIVPNLALHSQASSAKNKSSAQASTSRAGIGRGLLRLRGTDCKARGRIPSGR